MSIPDIREARALLERGAIQEAVQALEALVARFPRYAAAYALLATAYEAVQAWPQAVAAWQDAAQLVPGSQAIRSALQRAALQAAHPPEPPAMETPPPEPPAMDAPPPEPPADREDEDEPTIAGPFAGAEMPRAWFTGLSWEDEEERSWDDEDATAEDAFAPLAGADPVEADPVEADPVEADPVEADPVEADPVEADPVEADPVEADAVEADAVEADPVEADRAAGPSPEERVADFEDLDRLIEELEQARIVPRPDIDAIPTPDLEDEIDDMVSETLARIYAAQQQFDEAARVYDALARQQPDRAAEFREQAARMRARHQT